MKRSDLSHLRPLDILNIGTLGLRARKTRTALTSLGIAIGIAAMIAVLGITSSSDAQLQAELNALGPNLLKITPGDSVTGDEVLFPAEAAEMVARIGPVDEASAIAAAGTTVRRTEFIPAGQTGGISVLTADLNLLRMVDATIADGEFLTSQSAQLPNVVLGAVAADRLGIHGVDNSPQVFMTNTYFTVVGVLDPIPLAPNIDRSALIGPAIAETLFETERSPSLVYARTDPDIPDDQERFDAVRQVIAATVIPSAPNEVAVSRPSDLLSARESSEAAFTGLLLGLGAVALLVGGVGIANVMVISVLERRTEIGVRRALGATKRHIRLQFVVESALLASLGGIGGVIIGAAITAGYANSQDWVISVPLSALALGIGAALTIGALAGLYPAARAASLDPAEAVRPAG